MTARDGDIDFEAEGLLDGVDGEAREARLALLRELLADGVEIEELRDATAAGRLALLPVERALAGSGPRFTPREVAAESGLDLNTLQRARAALGVPYPDPDARVLTDVDVEAAKRTKAFLDAGLPEEGILQVARTIGMGTARIAQANRDLIVKTLMQPGDTEHELGRRFAEAARGLMPLIGPTLTYGLQTHMLEQIRRDVIDAGNLAAGELAGAAEVSVCFTDLVGFTKLGEQIGEEELGQVVGRLEEMAITVAEAPVTLVKLIGDAAMLVSPDSKALIAAALRLVAAADEETDDFPRLRAGVARGSTLMQAGDYYGTPVNMASRITGIALPGSVLVSQEAKEAAGEGLRFSFAGERRLKGFDRRVKVFRARPPEADI